MRRLGAVCRRADDRDGADGPVKLSEVCVGQLSPGCHFRFLCVVVLAAHDTNAPAPHPLGTRARLAPAGPPSTFVAGQGLDDEPEPDAEHPHILGEHESLLGRAQAALFTHAGCAQILTDRTGGERGQPGTDQRGRHDGEQQCGTQGYFGRGQ